MIKKLFNRFLDYIAFVILGLLGLAIFNVLYLTWFTDTGRFILSILIITVTIIWAFVRAFTKR